MKVMPPYQVTDATLVSNVPETEYGTYNTDATYAAGDRVISSHRVYQSIVAGNTGNPVSDTTKWLEIGPSNRWAMFDTVNGTATSSDGGIDVSVTVPSSRADGLALFSLAGTAVQVTVTTAASGTVYDETFSLISTAGIVSWYDYFFAPVVYRTDLVLSDLPLDVAPTVRVQISNSAGSASCGSMLLGQLRDMGGTLYGARAGIQDYSKKEADAFGNYVITPRAYAKRLAAKLTIDNDQIDNVYQLLAELRTTPCVWIGADDYAATASLGFWKDYAIEIAYPTKSIVSIEIEGLT